MSAGWGNDCYPQRWYNKDMRKFDEYRWVPCDTTADAGHLGSTVERLLNVTNIVGADREALQLGLAMNATEIYSAALNDTLPIIQFQ
jgi:hypothetical protein